MRLAAALSLVAILMGGVSSALAEDWPQWRHDAARSAACGEALPAQPVVRWSRQLGAVEAAWPHEPRLYFDANLHPVVAGKTLLVGSSRNDRLMALDMETGAEKWSFSADGPIRLAPAVADGRAYVGSDDGYLYCLDVESGKLLWKFYGADTIPAAKVLGNGRLISTHPVRGGPVVAAGRVYFAAGVWPWLGVFVHCLDAKTGKALWTNDSTGSLWVGTSNGHAEAQGNAGPSPQGHLVIARDKLLVPSGRSLPACLDLATGKLLWFRPDQARMNAGPLVVAAGKFVMCSGVYKSTALDLETGVFLADLGAKLVATEDTLYWATGSASLKDATVAATQAMAPVKLSRATFPQKATFKLNNLLFAAKDVLCGGAKDFVGGYDAAGGKPLWTVKIKGVAVEGLAADGKIVIVTAEGGIWCLGEAGGEAKVYEAAPAAPLTADPQWAQKAAKAIELAPVKKGVCLVVGLGSGRMAEEMVRQGQFHVVVLEKDEAKAAAWRRKMDAAGLYGVRATVIGGEFRSVKLPQYLAPVVVSEETVGGDSAGRELMRVLRPYGGIAVLPEASTVALGNGFGRKAQDGTVIWERIGGPAGSANWDHEYGDAAKTLFSKDQIKGPFGVLWYGGEVDKANLYIPSWLGGPGVQVVDGRMFIEGEACLNCVDAYTGDMLWKAQFTPPKENLTGPGRDRGYYFVTASDAVYVGFYDTCYKLDIATGEIKQRFVLPVEKGKPAAMWGYFCVQGDLLLAVESRPIDFWAKEAPKDLGKMTVPELTRAVELYDALVSVKLAQRAATTKRAAALEANLAELLNGAGIDSKIPRAAALKEFAKPVGADSYPLALRTGNALVVMDRQTGKVRWSREMAYGLSNEAVAMGKDRVFIFDAVPSEVAGVAESHKTLQEYEPKLLALDLQTGRELWSAGKELEASFQRLTYSPETDVLVMDGDKRQGRRGSDGSMLWSQKPTAHHKPPILLHGKLVTLLYGSWDLVSGQQTVRPSPLTEQSLPWEWHYTRGCNFAVASEHMIIARSSTAAYLDLDADAGMTNLGGFRSGCRNNMVAAGGILSIPRLTGCTCGYPIQASVALVHDDSVEAWTTYGPGAVKGRVKRLGINLGAPGDRRAKDGTLWLEYPNRGGVSPELTVKVLPENVKWFCSHSSRVTGGSEWITASGAEGLQQVTVTVAAGANDDAAYTVRLYFAEPQAQAAGQRVFDVMLQGQQALKDFDIVKEAGGIHRTIVKEFRGIKVKESLTIELKAAAKSPMQSPLLCGIEIVENEK